MPCECCGRAGNRLHDRGRGARRDQSELPRLEVASPADRPPYCITIETLMAFAGRVKAHVARCPRSDYAAAVAEWDKTRTDYAKLFGRYRCKRTR